MRRPRRVGGRFSFGILVGRNGSTDSGHFGPTRRSNVFDVLAGRESAAAVESGSVAPVPEVPEFARSGPSAAIAATVRSAVDSFGRARRGTSGALNLQSAPAGLNSHPRSPLLRAAASSDVEDRIPRSGESRTVSGPEGSSTKRSSSGAAERPGPSRSSRWARVASGRRWVHGIEVLAARHRTGAS